MNLDMMYLASKDWISRIAFAVDLVRNHVRLKLPVSYVGLKSLVLGCSTLTLLELGLYAA